MSNLGLVFKSLKKSQGILEDLFENPGLCFVVHYSCESFYDRTSGISPRITSIAVKSLGSGQITSFSIHLIAERMGIPFASINQNYNTLETDMLREYYSFVQAHNHSKWIHWKMNDTNYGFKAIEQRYQALQGTPTVISDHNKYDLSSLIRDIYGENYSDHPRMQSLIKMNQITDKDFMNGEQEANAFSQGNYLDLHRSTLRKVGVLHTIGEKAATGTLNTNAWGFRSTWMNILVTLGKIQKHWLTTLILFVAAFLGLFTDIGSLIPKD